MIRHQHPRVQHPLPKRHNLFENLDETDPIPIVAIDVATIPFQLRRQLFPATPGLE
ncbi:MAG TPA: hypothetical protein VMS12_03095 [Thermoanaerobaculia bacterium]|nr:hypothetical protein [Thermoanaerobaculia bacterium]